MAKTYQIRDEFSALTQNYSASNEARRTRSCHCFTQHYNRNESQCPHDFFPCAARHKPAFIRRKTTGVGCQSKDATDADPLVSNRARWFSGDLHMHTPHSDGDWTVDDLVSSARAEKLDFISITDHNTASHHREIDARAAPGNDLLVMRGEEITT